MDTYGYTFEPYNIRLKFSRKFSTYVPITISTPFNTGRDKL